jgi:AAA domain
LIPDRTGALQQLHLERIAHSDEGFKTNGHQQPADAIFSDEEVIDLCRSARNAPKFERLYDLGDISEYDHDDSRADQGLVSVMAFYTQDPEQLDRLFRRSALYRPDKWGRRPDYRYRTIQKALSGLVETYTPSEDDGVRLVVSNAEGSSSQRPTPIGIGTLGRKPKVLRFSEIEAPGPRHYILKDLVLAAYVTLLHGDGGVAKSLLALALAVAVAGGSTKWLGRDRWLPKGS